MNWRAIIQWFANDMNTTDDAGFRVTIDNGTRCIQTYDIVKVKI